MREIADRLALVLGGASGVGLGLSQALLAAGARVVVADLVPDHLDEARVVLANAGGRVATMRLDVTDRAAMAAAASDIAAAHGPLHILCPVAGVGVPLRTQDCAYGDWDWVFGVNVGGLINAIVSFLPGMIAHGEGGHIVATGSITSVIPHHEQGIYTGSKFAIRGIAESLRLSLANERIGVTLACPGLVRSRHLDAERTRPAQLATGAVPPAPPPPGMLSEVADAAMDPLELGEMIVAAIRENQPYVFSHPEIRPELAELCEALLAAVPDEGAAPPARMAFESRMREARQRARVDANRLAV